MNQNELSFWSIPVDKLFAQLETKSDGLTSGEAEQRVLRWESIYKIIQALKNIRGYKCKNAN